MGGRGCRKMLSILIAPTVWKFPFLGYPLLDAPLGTSVSLDRGLGRLDPRTGDLRGTS